MGPAGLEVPVGAPVHLLLQGAVSAAAGHHHHHQHAGPHLGCWHLISSLGRVLLNTQYSNLVLRGVKISDSCRCLYSVLWRVLDKGYLTTSQMLRLRVRLYITRLPCNHFCHCVSNHNTLEYYFRYLGRSIDPLSPAARSLLAGRWDARRGRQPALLQPAGPVRRIWWGKQPNSIYYYNFRYNSSPAPTHYPTYLRIYIQFTCYPECPWMSD